MNNLDEIHSHIFFILVTCNTKNSIISKDVVLPNPIEAYSHATYHNELIFISGQIGIDQKTNTLNAGIEGQIIQIFKNLETILKESGSDLDSIKKTTIFVTDSNHYELVNKIYGCYFTNQFPARSTIVVATLPKKALIEIECIAVLKNK